MGILELVYLLEEERLLESLEGDFLQTVQEVRKRRDYALKGLPGHQEYLARLDRHDRGHPVLVLHHQGYLSEVRAVLQVANLLFE